LLLCLSNWGAIGLLLVAYAVLTYLDREPQAGRIYHHRATLGTTVLWDYWTTNPPVQWTNKLYTPGDYFYRCLTNSLPGA